MTIVLRLTLNNFRLSAPYRVPCRARAQISGDHRFQESSRNDEMELIQEADRSKWIAHSNHNIKRFIKGDIERMTNNYRTILGRGAFGEVYKGVLDDKSMVAVKKLMGTVEEKFAKELIVHREINHKNVVRLIGYCAEENALMLVMEYISNGNLSDLHDDNRSIPLDIRLRIAIECAEALAYMHSHMYTQVIHGDIKPENLLLDSNFHAKLSDFGISRLANTDKTLRTENVIGSIGYMDPLLSMDGRLTVKSDVYSFGVVLIELITKRKALVDNVNNVYAFTDALTRGIGGVREMFDVDIASKKNMKVLEGVAKLAGECLRMNRDKRPEMIAVAECLRVLQKSSYQDKGRQRVDLLSWVRKSIPTPPALVNTRANILMRRQFSLAEMKSATNNFDKSATKMRDVLLDLEHALQLQENGEEGGSMSHDFMELQENGEEGDSMSESDDSMRTIVFLDSMDSNDLAPSVA